MPNARILGTGHYLPEQIVTNHDLEKILDTTDEWIRARSGIAQRHAAEEGVGASGLAVPAAERALESAGVAADEVDLIVCCTMSPDYLFPPTACVVQGKLGARRAAAFDLGAGCSGFVYGLTTATMYLRSGLYKTAVVIGAECVLNRLRYVGFQKRDTAVLFGDGAGAVVLGAVDDADRGVMTTYLRADGASGDVLVLPGGGSKQPATAENIHDLELHTIQMNGQELFKKAVVFFSEAVSVALERSGLTAAELDYFVPHQANLRIIQAAARRANLPDEKVIVNIDRVANTTAASIPIALDELNRSGRLAEGSTVLLASFGAGLTWASALLRW